MRWNDLSIWCLVSVKKVVPVFWYDVIFKMTHYDSTLQGFPERMPVAKNPGGFLEIPAFIDIFQQWLEVAAQFPLFPASYPGISHQLRYSN